MQYEEGYSIDGRYCLKKYIGSGSFGEVWVATDTQTDLEVAVKIYISMDAQGLSDFKKEFQLSFNFNHTNLLHANYLGVNSDDNRPYLVMPYCPDGSSTKLCGVIDEAKLWVFIRDVASGLAYLHSQQPPVIHQDIKPDNILILKSGEFVITDFGISKQLRSSLRKSATNLNSAGAVSYMGPERFSKQYQAVKASDVWSLGVAIYELATGDLPFCGMGGSMQKRGADIPELPASFSEDINEVMTACLAAETWDRPTAAQIAEFADRYIKGEKKRPLWLKNSKQVIENEPVKVDVASKSAGVSAGENKSEIKRTVILSSTAPADIVVSKPVSRESSRKIPVIIWILAAIAGLAAGYLLNVTI